MEVVLGRAKVVGWEKAVQECAIDPWVKDYVLEASRALWLDLLPLKPGDVFVDSGCGWGSISCAAARKLWQVLAIDDTLQRVQFTKIRADQQHLYSVVPVKASVFRIPLGDGCADAVAYNGVLEWLGLSDTTRTPTVLQQAAIREAYRVLKPGGYLYIGIENRYSLRYFLGKRDDHSFLRFTSILPRPLANRWSVLLKGLPYSTYTHSLREYKRLLRECGFEPPKVFLPFPNYRFPQVVIPSTYRGVCQYLLNRFLTASTARQAFYLGLYLACSIVGLHAMLAHSYCLVASKEDKI